MPSFVRISHLLVLSCIAFAAAAPPALLRAQAPPAARQVGTVSKLAGGLAIITNAAGTEISITLPEGVRVLQLPPGTTDLKAGTLASVEDIAVGDRILAIGAVGASPLALTATRVILMKSSDIAARNAADQAEWQKRGTGGLVKAVDGAAVTISAGAKTVTVNTTPTTVFKRYADDSVAFADAKSSSLAGLHAGDQLRARGAFSEDRSTLTAEEIVSGTFANYSGIVSSVDTQKKTLTLKDLATKKSVTVAVTAKSDLRRLPPEAAARFAVRSGPAAVAPPAGAPTVHAPGSSTATPPAASGAERGTRPAPAGASSAEPAASGSSANGQPAARRAGLDLSQMLSHLPTQTVADLKAGDAVMIVATQDQSQAATAITLLSGVESILAATPSGGRPLTLSPWNIGEPEGGGGGGAQQ